MGIGVCYKGGMDAVEHRGGPANRANNKRDGTMYQVIDIQTGQIVGTYGDIKKARAAANRKDLAYGAVRYVVRIAK